MLLTLLGPQGAAPPQPEPDGASRGGYAFPRAQQFRPPRRPKKFLIEAVSDDDDVAVALALLLLTN